jgi:hypothetical protein
VAGVEFSYWDLWFLVSLLADWGGSWEALAAPFVEQLDLHLGGPEREDAESKLSHAADLRARLALAGATAADLVGDSAGDRKLQRKARVMLLERDARDSHPSPPMVRTPRRVLSERALRGRWPSFPISPAPFDAIFMVDVEARLPSTPEATFRLVERLRVARDRLVAERSGNAAALLAVHRAHLTALREAFARANDSFGELGVTLEKGVATYCALPWRDTELGSDDYYSDILELAAWECHGVSWTEGLRLLFAQLQDGEVERVEAILRGIRDEMLAARLDFQAELPLTLLGRMHVARGNLGRFPGLAGEMGSREWERVTDMAEAAWHAGARALAIEVFDAANQPDPLRWYVKKRCLELTGHELPEPRHLRVLS